MVITPENLVRHELVGLLLEVTESTNPDNVGITGRVVDESRNTITIDTRKGTRNLIKDQCTFSFTIPDGRKVRVRGSLLVARPEDRTKKKLKKW